MIFLTDGVPNTLTNCCRWDSPKRSEQVIYGVKLVNQLNVLRSSEFIPHIELRWWVHSISGSIFANSLVKGSGLFRKSLLEMSSRCSYQLFNWMLIRPHSRRNWILHVHVYVSENNRNGESNCQELMLGFG